MPSARISSTTPYTTYKMWVTAKNVMGEGERSDPVSAQFNCTWAQFDEAASSATEFIDIEDGGDSYRLAKFEATGSHSLVFKTAGICQALIISAGGGVGNVNAPWTSTGGAGGGGHGFFDLHVQEDSYVVKVGSGSNSKGQESMFANVFIEGGGANGGSGPNGGGGTGYGGTAGAKSNRPEQGGGNGGSGYPTTTYGGGGGGGGATENGGNGITEGPGGKGGDGFTTTFTGETKVFCGGGGGGNGGAGGAGGGGAGNANQGIDFTGGGGGGLRGNGADRLGGRGGHGVVYVRVM